MDLIFITEARFIKLENGQIYSLEGSFSYSLYKRYLEYYDNVTIIARCKAGQIEDVLEANLVTKENVFFYSLPYYIGFNSFLANYLKLKKAIIAGLKKHLTNNSSVICRIPGRIGAIAINQLEKLNKPYGIEVVGDPYDVLSNGATNNRLAPLIRFFSFTSLKKIAFKAPAALYVTKSKLQERYPCNNFSVGVSDVIMQDSSFIQKPKKNKNNTTIKIISVGTLDQLYKAPDTILDALKILKDKNVDFTFTWVGEGLFKEKMIRLAEKLGISQHVNFIGKLSSGDAVIKELDKNDIFLMASRMEGLPRAMVEAMARALPCIGTNICGMTELLDANFLVNINSPDEIVTKIIALQNNETYDFHSERNWSISKLYRNELLNVDRLNFHNYLKSISANKNE
jgi:glycosyltransferase involved in cell wall biosynthesis